MVTIIGVMLIVLGFMLIPEDDSTLGQLEGSKKKDSK